MNFKSRAYVVFLPNIALKQLQSKSGLSNDPDEERDISKQFGSGEFRPVERNGNIDDGPDELDTLLYETETLSHSLISDQTNEECEIDITKDEINFEDFDDEPGLIRLVSDEYQSEYDDEDRDNLGKININMLMSSHYHKTLSEQVKWDEMPKFYYGKDQPNVSLNLLCWSCACNVEDAWLLPISSEKLAIPEIDTKQEIQDQSDLIDSDKSRHIRSKQIKAFKVRGVYCNVLCMGRYLQFPSVLDSINLWQTKELIKLMFKERVGRELREIPIALEPHIMAKYCGPSGLTEKQYRDANMAILPTYMKS